MKCGTVTFLIILAAIFGLALGLLCGWVIWPVEWIDASPADLSHEFQVVYTNMAIDTYALNQNQEQAIVWFSYLGSDGYGALEEILENPTWVTPSNAQAYADVISQGVATGYLPQPDLAEEVSLTKRLSQPPLLGYLLAGLFLSIVAIVLLVILIYRLLSRKDETEELLPAPETVTEIESAPITSEPEQITNVEPEIVEDAQVETAISSEEGGIPIPTEESIRVDVAEAADETDHEGAGVAAAAMAGIAGIAVGAVAAGHSDEEEQLSGEEAILPVSEIVEEQAAVQPVSGEGIGLGEAALIAGGVAAIAGGDEEDSETELPTEEESESELDWALEETATKEDEANGWEPETTPEVQPDLGKYNRKVVDIEGVGEVFAGKLNDAGLFTTHDLLQQCATPKGREELTVKTGISGKLILEWANHADMMRIRGIGPQWSDLLEMAGVNTVREMSMRNPENLFEKLKEINEEKKLVRQLPTKSQVEGWVEEAKYLPKILTY